jgi:hypothetical protein
MRRFLQLATVLLMATVAAGSLHATVNAPHAIPAVAAAPQAALICILPRCNGPYCRASNGCWVCCTN